VQAWTSHADFRNERVCLLFPFSLLAFPSGLDLAIYWFLCHEYLTRTRPSSLAFLTERRSHLYIPCITIPCIFHHSILPKSLHMHVIHAQSSSSRSAHTHTRDILRFRHAYPMRRIITSFFVRMLNVTTCKIVTNRKYHFLQT